MTDKISATWNRTIEIYKVMLIAAFVDIRAVKNLIKIMNYNYPQTHCEI